MIGYSFIGVLMIIAGVGLSIIFVSCPKQIIRKKVLNRMKEINTKIADEIRNRIVAHNEIIEE